MKHLSIKVSGVVQGVYFRVHTKQKADELGLTGFIRNEADGSVYIEAEGEDDVLTKFLGWCGHGPPGAVVSKLVSDEGPVKKFENFEIWR